MGENFSTIEMGDIQLSSLAFSQVTVSSVKGVATSLVNPFSYPHLVPFNCFLLLEHFFLILAIPYTILYVFALLNCKL